uniref:uncharacterized protein LOC122610914 n=1 Tax=Erigeron canadensis TaxID=72917 RepID=UPI001CB98B88|nr:uncharacterized protein LOC122610914 [Erigeron canadensis]
MPVAKFLGTSSLDAMKVDEGADSLDTFIRQSVGKEPLFSLSRTGDSSMQWIQFLHQLDQQDLSGWPLLAPTKVQMQKCDKCARDFFSPINYRRHTRVHRRSLNFYKDPQKYRDLLGAFWDKLSYEEAKEIMSFKDVNLEEVPGSSIVKNLSATLRKTLFLSLPQTYLRAGSALVDIIQGRPSRLTITSQELFSILDDASERTFLCAGSAESLQKYVFDGEPGKIALEMKNLIACTSFLLEQKLVKACLADKDAEALRCQKLLFEEEEAAQKRQTQLLERKRQRKLRQKEQRVRDQLKVDLSNASTEASSPQSSVEVDSSIPDESCMPLETIEPSNSENDMDVGAHGGSTVDRSDYVTSRKIKHQKVHKNGLQHYVARWQVPNSQKSRRNNFQFAHNFKREQAHKHKEQRAAVGSGSKVWAKKHKSEYSGGEFVKTRVQNDSINQTDQNNCELMIGSISVTVRKCPGQQHKVNTLAEAQESCNAYQLAESSSRGVLGGNTTPDKEPAKTLPTMSPHDSCELNGNDSKGTSNFHPQMEDRGKQEGMPLTIHAAKAFLAQRWKEVASREHVKLVLLSSEPPARSTHYSSEPHEHVILVSAEN